MQAKGNSQERTRKTTLSLNENPTNQQNKLLTLSLHACTTLPHEEITKEKLFKT